MLELLVSFLLLCGSSFTMTDTGQVNISSGGSAAIEKTRTSDSFEKLGGEAALDAIVITDGTDGKE